MFRTYAHTTTQYIFHCDATFIIILWLFVLCLFLLCLLWLLLLCWLVVVIVVCCCHNNNNSQPTIVLVCWMFNLGCGDCCFRVGNAEKMKAQWKFEISCCNAIVKWCRSKSVEGALVCWAFFFDHHPIRPGHSNTLVWFSAGVKIMTGRSNAI